MGKGERIAIRCTENERMMIEAKAAQAGLSLSEYLRRAALGRRITVKTDVRLIGELRRLGGMLKHLYPKKANWTVQEKRAYWTLYTQIQDVVSQIQEERNESSGRPDLSSIPQSSLRGP